MRTWFRGKVREGDKFSREESEAIAATTRWRAHNAQARIDGCKCGKPATHVRAMFGTVGAVPAEVYSCAEHVNVNGWSSNGEGGWIPGAEYDASALAWMSSPREFRRPLWTCEHGAVGGIDCDEYGCANPADHTPRAEQGGES